MTVFVTSPIQEKNYDKTFNYEQLDLLKKKECKLNIFQ